MTDEAKRETLLLLGAGATGALMASTAAAQNAMSEPDLPPVVYGGLKREELHRLGSVVLHEQYFGNLGGDGKAGGDIVAAIKKTYGSYEAWEAEFKRTAISLARGSGWCVLTYNVYTNELRNQWAWDHMHGAIAAVPLLVLDMYEHSYHMDYGSAAAKYVDAFLRNVNWEEVDRRFGARPGCECSLRSSCCSPAFAAGHARRPTRLHKARSCSCARTAT